MAEAAAAAIDAFPEQPLSSSAPLAMYIGASQTVSPVFTRPPTRVARPLSSRPHSSSKPAPTPLMNQQAWTIYKPQRAVGASR